MRDFSSSGQELEILSSFISIESFEEVLLSLLYTFHLNYCLVHGQLVYLSARDDKANSFYT